MKRKEESTDTCYNLHETGEHCVKLKKKARHKEQHII
jgi:hypothetical protein